QAVGAGVAQFLETRLAELGALGGQFPAGRRVEEGADALAERLVFLVRQPAPHPLAGQGDFEGLPGALVRPGQRAGQALAVVAEAAGEEAHDFLEPLALQVEAGKPDLVTAGAEQLPEGHRREGLEDHGTSLRPGESAGGGGCPSLYTQRG